MTQSATYQVGDYLTLANTVVDIKEENPWNVPNWRDASAYSEMANASQYQWKWEFSRRHPNYRNFWLMYQSNYDSSLPWDYVQRIWRSAGKLFGLDFLISPACDYSDFIEALMQKSRAVYLYEPSRSMDDFCRDALDDGRFLVSIDPTVPPHRLMKYLQAALEEKIQRRECEIGRKLLRYPERWEVKLFPEYLRVLDAQVWLSTDSSRTWGEVADGLEMDDESTVQKRFRAAVLWRDKLSLVPPI